MGYNYSLSITAFQAEDTEACLKALHDADSDIAECMEIRDGHLIFEPGDSCSKWCGAEEHVITVIAKHILPGTTCRIDWLGEDGERGGDLIGRDHIFPITYEEYVVVEDKTIPLHEAEILLTGCPDCPFDDKVRVACVADGESCARPGVPYSSTWNYHKNGPHAFFLLEDWRADVAGKDTILGYQEWVIHNLETLLHDISLDGVDAIEVAGCTDSDGIVEVRDEGDAEFFSGYTHRPNEGVECQCDFNTKAQAVEFARALAGRTGIPVYGNLCNIDDGGAA